MTLGSISLQPGGPTEAGVVARAISVLRAVAEAGEPISVKDLAGTLDLPQSTVHRLLDQLLQAGMITRAPRRRYRASVEFSRIGALVARKTGVLHLARPIMEAVAHETRETCMLGMLLPATVRGILVDKEDAQVPVPYQISMHSDRSLLWGASGLCLLAWQDRREVTRALDRGEQSPLDGASPPSEPILLARLAAIRDRGYAITHGERTRGAVGMAAPIFGANGRVVADLCLTIPQSRFSTQREASFARLLVREAGRLSQIISRSRAAGMP